jgi:hypothetical protein
MYNTIYYFKEEKYKKTNKEEALFILEKYKNTYMQLEDKYFSDFILIPKRAIIIQEENIALLEIEEEILNNYLINDFRNRRNQECFPIINRGKLWYDNLTQEQLEELNKWYNDWLNVTETLVEPIKPKWIK